MRDDRESVGRTVTPAVVAGWTIGELRPSGDTIPYPVAGRLYEATAAVEADRGTVTPMVSNFNARASDGETYRTLYNVATPQGRQPVSPAAGWEIGRQDYFDVTGAKPEQCRLQRRVQDLLVWTSGAPNVAPAPAAAAPVPAAPLSSSGQTRWRGL